MRFEKTRLEGVLVGKLEPITDERGYFARAYCEQELADAGVRFHSHQMNLSHNTHGRTLRGLHYQETPHGEPKLVRCVRGRIWDAVVDLRRGSSSYLAWFGTELSAENGEMLYIPEGCAHGFITLEPTSDVYYVMGAPFVASSARGVRWDDPAFGIEWPEAPAIVSDRDAGYPDFDPAYDNRRVPRE